jgi:hypothetical protein
VFYFYQDLCFGPRFLYESAGMLVALSAAGLVETARWLERRPALAAFPRAGAGAAAAIAGLLVLGAAILNVPARVALYADHYWGVEGRFAARLARQVEGRALVLLTSDYRHVAYLNPQPPSRRVIFVRSLGGRDEEILARHPDRPAFLEVAGRLQPLRSAAGAHAH